MVKRKVLMVLCLFILCVAGCQGNGKITTWAMAGPDLDHEYNELTGRVGYAANGIEAGAEVMMIGIHNDHILYGAYALGELGPAYAGFHALVPEDEGDGALFGPIAGTMIEIGGIQTVVEYQYQEGAGDLDAELPNVDDEHKVFAGIRVKF